MGLSVRQKGGPCPDRQNPGGQLSTHTELPARAEPCLGGWHSPYPCSAAQAESRAPSSRTPVREMLLPASPPPHSGSSAQPGTWAVEIALGMTPSGVGTWGHQALGQAVCPQGNGL